MSVVHHRTPSCPISGGNPRSPCSNNRALSQAPRSMRPSEVLTGAFPRSTTPVRKHVWMAFHASGSTRAVLTRHRQWKLAKQSTVCIDVSASAHLLRPPGGCQSTHYDPHRRVWYQRSGLSTAAGEGKTVYSWMDAARAAGTVEHELLRHDLALSRN